MIIAALRGLVNKPAQIFPGGRKAGAPNCYLPGAPVIRLS